MKSCLLMIMNPRQIEESVGSFRMLDVAKVWLTGFTESELEAAVAQVVAETHFDFYAAISDDGVLHQGALDAVLAEARPDRVVTGYCNLDLGVNMNRTNATKGALHEYGSTVFDYYRLDELYGWPVPTAPTAFVNMTVTTMPRTLWERYPFAAMSGPPGNSSDWSLSSRLEADEVPRYVVREGFVLHTKPVWNRPDTDESRHLVHLGKREVTYA